MYRSRTNSIIRRKSRRSTYSRHFLRSDCDGKKCDQEFHDCLLPRSRTDSKDRLSSRKRSFSIQRAASNSPSLLKESRRSSSPNVSFNLDANETFETSPLPSSRRSRSAPPSAQRSRKSSLASKNHQSTPSHDSNSSTSSSHSHSMSLSPKSPSLTSYRNSRRSSNNFSRHSLTSSSSSESERNVHRSLRTTDDEFTSMRNLSNTPVSRASLLLDRTMSSPSSYDEYSSSNRSSITPLPHSSVLDRLDESTRSVSFNSTRRSQLSPQIGRISEYPYYPSGNSAFLEESQVSVGEKVRNFLKRMQTVIFSASSTLRIQTSTETNVEDGRLVIDSLIILMPDDISDKELEKEMEEVQQLEPLKISHGFEDENNSVEEVEMTINLSSRIIMINNVAKIGETGKTEGYWYHPIDTICPAIFDKDMGFLQIEYIYSRMKVNEKMSRKEIIVLCFGKEKTCTKLRQKVIKDNPIVVGKEGQAIYFDEEALLLEGNTIILERNMNLHQSLWSRPVNWKEKINGKFYLRKEEAKSTPSSNVVPMMDTMKKDHIVKTDTRTSPISSQPRVSDIVNTSPGSSTVSTFHISEKTSSSKKHNTTPPLSSKHQPPVKKDGNDLTPEIMKMIHSLIPVIIKKATASVDKKTEASTAMSTKTSNSLTSTSAKKSNASASTKTANTTMPKSIKKTEFYNQEPTLLSASVPDSLFTLPKKCLVINAPYHEPKTIDFKIGNDGLKPLAWSMKTNRENFFNAMPHNGILEVKEVVNVNLSFLGFVDGENPKDTDRVSIVYIEVEPGTKFSEELFQRNVVGKKVVSIEYNG